jgi:hypothetical protein
LYEIPSFLKTIFQYCPFLTTPEGGIFAPMSDLKNYIEQKGSYTDGVRILEILSPFAPELKELKGFIQKGFAPSAAHEKLYKILRGYYDKLPVNVPSKSDTTTPSTIATIAPIEEETPDIIIKLRAEQRTLRDQRRAIHLTIEDTEAQADRAEKCRQVKSLSKRIDFIFKQLDDWKDNKRLPSVATIGDARAGGLEVLELTKTAQYFKERISRLKAWIDDDKTPTSKREKYKTELAIKQSEILVIKNQLSNLKNG